MLENKKIKKTKTTEGSDSFRLGWKKLASEISKKKVRFSILIAIIVTTSVLFASTKYFLGKIIDHFGKGKTEEFVFFDWFSLDILLISFLAFAIAVAVDVLLSSYKDWYYQPLLSFDIYKGYIKETFFQVVSYPTTFFKNTSIGKVTYSIDNGANTLYNTTKMGATIGAPVSIVSNMFLISVSSWEIFLVATLGFIAFLSIFFFSRKRISYLEEKYNEKKKTVNEGLVEKINLIFEIKKNNKEIEEGTAFSKHLIGNQDKVFHEKIRFDFFVDFLRSIVYITLTIVTLYMSISFYQEGRISLGEVTVINTAMMFLIWEFGWIIQTVVTFVKDMTIIGDTESLLQYTPETYIEGKVRAQVQGNIQFKNVHFTYTTEEKEKEFSLNNLNIEIPRGAKVAFVGESGGGKSTSVELIGGFTFPNTGEVLIDNIPTTDINLNDLRSSIAYVSQDIAIFNTTIGENISYGLKEQLTEEQTKKQIKQAAQQANIHEFIESLPEGYDTQVGEKGLKLSGGQRQRVAIARAFLRNPKILILDEPTSALDIESEIKITSALEHIMKDRTTIIIAHRISTIRDADTIYVFKNGSIVEQGDYTQLINQQGVFANMVKMHEGVG